MLYYNQRTTNNNTNVSHNREGGSGGDADDELSLSSFESNEGGITRNGNSNQQHHHHHHISNNRLRLLSSSSRNGLITSTNKKRGVMTATLERESDEHDSHNHTPRTQHNKGHKRMTMVSEALQQQQQQQLHTGLSPRFEAVRFFTPPGVTTSSTANLWANNNNSTGTITNNTISPYQYQLNISPPPSPTWVYPADYLHQQQQQQQQQQQINQVTTTTTTGTTTANQSLSSSPPTMDLFFLDDDGIETFGEDDDSRIRSDAIVEIQSSFVARISQAALARGIHPSHPSVTQVMESASRFTRLIERRAWIQTTSLNEYIFYIHRIAERISLCNDDEISLILHSDNQDNGILMLTQ
jgi:hypothetical protein